MKTDSQNQVLQPDPVSDRGSLKIDWLGLLDRGIRPAGTCSLLAGFGAAMMGMSPASDYLVAGGALLHFAAWFERWWQAK